MAWCGNILVLLAVPAAPEDSAPEPALSLAIGRGRRNLIDRGIGAARIRRPDLTSLAGRRGDATGTDGRQSRWVGVIAAVDAARRWFGQDTGDSPEGPVRRVRVAIFGRLGATGEVFGVGHRTRLELTV